MNDALYCDSEFRTSSGLSTHRYPLPFPDETEQQGYDFRKPDCATYKGTAPYLLAYCAGKKITLSSTERQKINDAIARIRAKGGACVEAADLAQDLFSKGDLVFFPRSNFAFNGYAPVNGKVSAEYRWAILDRTWLTRWYDPSHATDPGKGVPKGMTLQMAIVHEMDHLRGYRHKLDAQGDSLPMLTEHTIACGDNPQ